MPFPSSEQRLAPTRRPESSPVGFQRWSHLLFLHWEAPVDLLAQTLPDGLSIDTHDGKGYLGIVPFFMERVRPRFLPPVPGLSWFLELNLRTYVYDEQGRPGVWFYSLDANQRIAVELARSLFHLPYQHARMSGQVEAETVTFQSRRKTGPHQETAHYRYRPSSSELVSQEGSLEFFLLERYLLFASDARNGLKVGQVHHHRYPFHQAECSSPSTLPFLWNGFEEPSSPPVSALYSPGVDVEIHPLRSFK